MTVDLEFTGERFLPGAAGSIAYEHWHRYGFALRIAKGRRVLDAASGEGYGSALLAQAARDVVGVDLDPAAVAHAAGTYRQVENVRFAAGSVASLPFADGTFDLVVSFETIEHLPAALQAPAVREFARVLTSDGLLLISSPNRPVYSEARDYHNPFHLHELDRGELDRLLSDAFPAQSWHRQSPLVASAVWSEERAAVSVEALQGDGLGVSSPSALPEAVYFIVVAAKRADALPAPSPAVSLFVDRDDSEARRVEQMAAEVLRTDRLLRERQETCDRQTGHIVHLEQLVAAHAAGSDRQAEHIVHLEKLVAERERLVVERDGQIVQLRGELEREQTAVRDARHALQDAERQARLRSDETVQLEAENRRLEAALAAQERIIDYRQSVRWWLTLPWMRARLLWRRLGAEGRRG